MREADLVVVKGKTEPVLIHEILDESAESSVPNLMDVLNYYRDGLRLYRSQSWDQAMDCFQKSLQHHPGDRLSELYIECASHLKMNPPDSSWNGVWMMEGK